MGMLDSQLSIQLSAKISAFSQLSLIFDRSQLTFTSHLFLRFCIVSVLGELSTDNKFLVFFCI